MLLEWSRWDASTFLARARGRTVLSQKRPLCDKTPTSENPKETLRWAGGTSRNPCKEAEALEGNARRHAFKPPSPALPEASPRTPPPRMVHQRKIESARERLRMDAAIPK